MRAAPLLALVFLLPLCGMAQDLQEQFEALAVLSLQKSQTADASRPMFNDSRSFNSQLEMIQNRIASQDYDQAIRDVRILLGRTDNEAIRKALEKLLKTLEDEKSSQQKKVTEEFEALLKEASAQLEKASSPNEIEKLRSKLETFRDTAVSSNSFANRRISDRLNRAIEFLNVWQNLLIDEAEGNFLQALQSLNSLRSNHYLRILASPSLLTKKYEKLLVEVVKEGGEPAGSAVNEVLETIVESVKTPEDATAALTKLQRLTSIGGGPDYRMLHNLQNDLQSLVRMQRNFQEGAYARVISESSYSSDQAFFPRLDRLRNDLRLRAIAAANELPDLGTPTEGETLPAFIKRKAEDAYAAKKWQDLFIYLSVYSTLTGGGCVHNRGMQDGVAAFLAGQQLEAAGQFSNAVEAYSRCVAQIGELIPRQEATEALQRLRQEHPDAFGRKADTTASAPSNSN